MSHNSIIDDVFSKDFKHARKPSAQEILGIKINGHNGNARFHSRQFVPFAVQRDTMGKIIKEPIQFVSNYKNSTLRQLSQDINSNVTSQSSQAFRTKKTLIDARFKLHQVDHFRETPPKSHLYSVPQFTKDFQTIQNKDYQRKYKQAKLEEELWLSNGFKSIEFAIDKNDHRHLTPSQSQSFFQLTIKGHTTDKFNRKKPTQSLSVANMKKVKQMQQLSDIKQSSKLLFNMKPNRNPQLQEIEKNVKVHFNHPQLDRLKQSKKLQFKFVENLQIGDRKFKQKIEEYKTIKERMKKEMGKY